MLVWDNIPCTVSKICRGMKIRVLVTCSTYVWIFNFFHPSNETNSLTSKDCGSELRHTGYDIMERGETGLEQCLCVGEGEFGT
jgi:hypothetical protein